MDPLTLQQLEAQAYQQLMGAAGLDTSALPAATMPQAIQQPAAASNNMALADGPRYEGIVSSFSTASAWGFISCPELSSHYGKDVTFHSSSCGGLAVAKGQRVSFILDESTIYSDKPQARSIRLSMGMGQDAASALVAALQAAPPPAAPAVSSALAIPVSRATPDAPEAARYTGTVTTFSMEKAWGFIACPETAAIYGKDIFFHIKDCGGATIEKGMTVTFILGDDGPNGKPQARVVRLPGQEASSSRHLTPDQLLPAAIASGELSLATRYQGMVTSYSTQSAWGFISCTQLRPIFGKDVFFHHKDCGGETVSKGATVTFELDPCSLEGKPHARRVVVENQGAHAGSALAAIAAGSNNVAPGTQDLISLASALGGQLAGSIQSFSQQAGWGFIECPSLNLGSGRGVFFHVKDCSGFGGMPPQRGNPVTFSLGTGPSGKPQANNVVGILPPTPALTNPTDLLALAGAKPGPEAQIASQQLFNMAGLSVEALLQQEAAQAAAALVAAGGGAAAGATAPPAAAAPGALAVASPTALAAALAAQPGAAAGAATAVGEHKHAADEPAAKRSRWS